MPDVGVLELQIRDNSKEAGAGLDSFAEALKKVKQDVTGFTLDGVASQIKTIVEGVKDNTKTVEQLGNLFGSLAKFGKIKNLSIDTQQFADLKEAINGMSIGQTGTQLENIRKALSGTWDTNNLESAMACMNAVQEAAAGWQSAGTASTINAVAKSLEKYNNAIVNVSGDSPFQFMVTKMQENVSEIEKSSNKIKGESSDWMREVIQKYRTVGQNATDGMTSSMDDSVGDARSAGERLGNAAYEGTAESLGISSPSKAFMYLGEMAGAGFIEGLNRSMSGSLMKLNLQQFASGEGKLIEGPFETVTSKIQEATKSLETVQSANKDITGGMSDVSDVIKEIDYSKVNIQDYILGPVEMLKQRFEASTSSVHSFRETLSASIPVFRQYRDAVMGLESKKDIAGFSKKSGAQLLDIEKEAKAYHDLTSEIKENESVVDNRYESATEDSDAYMESISEETRLAAEEAAAIRKIQEAKFYSGSRKTKSLDETNRMADNLTQLDLLKAKLREAELQYNKYVNSLGAGDAKTIKAGLSVQKLRDQIWEYKNSLEEVSVTSSTESTGGFAESANVSAGAATNLAEKTSWAAKAVEALKKAVDAMGGSWVGFKGSIKSMFPHLSRLIKQFTSIARRMMIRSIIRQFTSGLREGLENVYYYSQAVGTSFAPAMDSAASSLLQMKNSIGAAVAPAVQALIPVLQTVVNWFINLINYVNQFFALLRGQQTWTRAVPASTEAFKKTEKAAKGAGAAIKDLLADWDELNIIQSDSGGGGGGAGTSAAEDYLKMFEEVTTFDKKISAFVDNLKENFGDVLGVIQKIGIAIAGWKISEAFSGALGTIAGLVGSAATLVLTFDLVSSFAETYMETGESGWLIADVLATLVGGVIMKRLLSNVLKGRLASYAIPITLFVSALANTKAILKNTDVNALSKENIATSIVAATETGAGVGYLIYKVGGVGAMGATGVGSGVSLITFGVLVGIKATTGVIDTGDISADTIKSDLLAAGTIGGGLAITAAAEGASVAGILQAGGGGAIFAFAALIGIQAILSTLPDKIEWGDKSLTVQEIQSFVDQTEFPNFDINAHINLAAESVQITDEKRTELIQKTQKLIPVINAIKLGVNTKESLEKLDEMVNGSGGVIDQFNEFQSARQDQLTIAFSSIKVIDETGADQSSDFAKAFSEGNTTLDSVMKNLGTRLSKALKDSYDESLKEDVREMAKETVLEISSAMMEINAIITSNQTEITMRKQFDEGFGALDQTSINAILEYYKAQKGKAKELAESQYQTLLDEAELQAATYKDLAERAKENGGEFGGYTTEYYLEMTREFENMYARLVEYRDRSIETALKFYQEGGEGLDMVRKYMLDLLKDRQFTLANFLQFNSQTTLEETTSQLFTGEDSVLYGKKAKQNVYDMMMNFVLSAINPSDRDTIRSAINTGVLQFSDFVNKEVMDQLADTLGITGELKNIWDQYVEEILGFTTETPVEVDIPVNTEFVDGKTGKISGARIIASAGMSDVGYAPYKPDTTSTWQTEEGAEQLATAVETGTKNAFENNSVMASILGYLLAIVQNTEGTEQNTANPPPVIINASTAFGRVAEKSYSNYAKVKGYD